jgi:hypothetical protein
MRVSKAQWYLHRGGHNSFDYLISNTDRKRASGSGTPTDRLCLIERGEWCPGADYTNSTKSMTCRKVGHSIFLYDHYAFWRECPTH